MSFDTDYLNRKDHRKPHSVPGRKSWGGGLIYLTDDEKQKVDAYLKRLRIKVDQ